MSSDDSLGGADGVEEPHAGAREDRLWIDQDTRSPPPPTPTGSHSSTSAPTPQERESEVTSPRTQANSLALLGGDAASYFHRHDRGSAPGCAESTFSRHSFSLT